jgi:hypothetical protein
MAPPGVLAVGGGIAARLTVPARRQDVAVLARFGGFRGSSGRFPPRDSPAGSAPSAETLGAQQRRRRAEPVADQLTWGSDVFAAIHVRQRCQASGTAHRPARRSMATTAFSGSCFGHSDPWSRRGHGEFLIDARFAMTGRDRRNPQTSNTGLQPLPRRLTGTLQVYGGALVTRVN